MLRYVAFLRGINLGRRRLEMGRLRGHFEELGLEDVETFLASGNVVFRAAPGSQSALEARIEAHLAGALGYEVDTFLRSLAELEEVARFDGLPPGEGGGWTPHVVFLREPAGESVVQRLRELETEDDRFVARGREVYWLRRGGLTDSVVSAADLARALGGATHTMRNLNTVRRIVQKFAP